MSKPKALIAPKAPFFSMAPASVENFSTQTLQLRVKLPMAKLQDPSAVSLDVTKQILHRPVPAGSEVAATPSQASGSNNNHNAVVVVDILSIQPLSDTIRQVAGKLEFTICVMTKVRTATVRHGVLVAVTTGPTAPMGAGTQRVSLLDAAEGCEIMCRCDSGDAQLTAASEGNVPTGSGGEGEAEEHGGEVALVAFEPNIIRLLSVKSARSQAGVWKREAEGEGRLVMRFERDPNAPDKRKDAGIAKVKRARDESANGGDSERAAAPAQQEQTTTAPISNHVSRNATTSYQEEPSTVVADSSHASSIVAKPKAPPAARIKGPSQSLVSKGTKVILDSDSDDE